MKIVLYGYFCREIRYLYGHCEVFLYLKNLKIKIKLNLEKLLKNKVL